MPRTARVAPKEHLYHVLSRGNNRQDVFEDEEDFRKYIDILLRYKEKYHFKLYHYVMMTNHVYLVIEPSEGGGNLSEIIYEPLAKVSFCVIPNEVRNLSGNKNKDFSRWSK